MNENIIVKWLNEEDKNKSNLIYMLIFPNWKYYIGQTTSRLEKRVQEHIYRKTEDTKKSRAVNKYNSFFVLVLEENIQKSELDEKEIYWIETYDTFNSGYNSTIGGGSSKGKIMSVESRKKISDAKRGHKPSAETKFKMSKALKGKLFSDETRLKISESKKGVTFTEEHKLKMSESKGHKFFDDFNNQFRSLPHAAEYYKCSCTAIRRLLKSGKKSKKLGTGFHY